MFNSTKFAEFVNVAQPASFNELNIQAEEIFLVFRFLRASDASLIKKLEDRWKERRNDHDKRPYFLPVVRVPAVSEKPRKANNKSMTLRSASTKAKSEIEAKRS